MSQNLFEESNYSVPELLILILQDRPPGMNSSLRAKAGNQNPWALRRNLKSNPSTLTPQKGGPTSFRKAPRSDPIRAETLRIPEACSQNPVPLTSTASCDES